METLTGRGGKPSFYNSGKGLISKLFNSQQKKGRELAIVRKGERVYLSNYRGKKIAGSSRLRGPVKNFQRSKEKACEGFPRGEADNITFRGRGDPALARGEKPRFARWPMIGKREKRNPPKMSSCVIPEGK